LLSHPLVREAVVLAREDEAGDKRLVAYYTAAQADDERGAEDLRNHLAAGLPDYMVPAAYIRLEELPLTANGKLDRKALPAPDGDAYGRGTFEAPVGPIETALARIWSEVLGIERISRNDSFFGLGGHSLLAIRVLERMRRDGLEVDIRALFDMPVLKELSSVTTQVELSNRGDTSVPGRLWRVL
jgi:aryl carrier-like protein